MGHQPNKINDLRDSKQVQRRCEGRHVAIEKVAARFAESGKTLELKVAIGPTTPGTNRDRPPRNDRRNAERGMMGPQEIRRFLLSQLDEDEAEEKQWRKRERAARLPSAHPVGHSRRLAPVKTSKHSKNPIAKLNCTNPRELRARTSRPSGGENVKDYAGLRRGCGEFVCG
jgi:hypothetical protein